MAKGIVYGAKTVYNTLQEDWHIINWPYEIGIALEISEIIFRDNHVKLVVEMPNPDVYSTKYCPHVPRLLFKYFPHLARHTCDNDSGYSFKKECLCTEIPHLFEHLIIEIQGHVRGAGVLKGETEWDWRVDPRGRFHVQVEYDNEMLVLGAIRVAQRIINALDDHEIEIVDVEEEVKQLRMLADLGVRVKEGPKAAEETTDENLPEKIPQNC